MNNNTHNLNEENYQCTTDQGKTSCENNSRIQSDDKKKNDAQTKDTHQTSNSKQNIYNVSHNYKKYKNKKYRNTKHYKNSNQSNNDGFNTGQLVDPHEYMFNCHHGPYRCMPFRYPSQYQNCPLRVDPFSRCGRHFLGFHKIWSYQRMRGKDTSQLRRDRLYATDG